MSSSRITNSTGTVQYYSSQTTAGSSTPVVSTTLAGTTPASPSPHQIIAPSASYDETLEHIQQTHAHMMTFFGVWQKGTEAVDVAVDGDAPEAGDDDDFDGLEIDLPGGNPNEEERKKGDKATRK